MVAGALVRHTSDPARSQKMLPFALLALLLAGLATAKRLGGQGFHFLVLQRDGQVFAVGYNEFGQLGVNTTTNAAFPQPMLSVTNVTDLSAGIYHSCVLDQGGQVQCTGSNSDYQLGDGTNANRLVPVPALGLESGMEEMHCGYVGSCAKATSGGVQCWGYIASLTRTSPLDITVPGGVQSMSLGFQHVCFVAVGGKLHCLGINHYGQLGTGNTAPQTAPTPVVGLAAGGIVSVACAYSHTCAVNAVGAMFCWGQYNLGRLGNPGIAWDSPNPVQVLGITSGAASAWTGWYNSFALMQNGTVQAFGRDIYGLFGTGSTGDKPAPIVFGQGVSGVAELGGGFQTTCVLLQNDQVRCTGDNQYGQLGVGSTTDSLTLVKMQLPTMAPTRLPTTSKPTKQRTLLPTKRSTLAPTTKQPTLVPTAQPTLTPTAQPTQTPTTSSPTKRPTTAAPTKRPTTATPTKRPTTKRPTTNAPTKRPTQTPTKRPTKTPTLAPTKRPTKAPTKRSTTTAPTKRPTTAKPVVS